jgi:hypothetical protein
MTRLREVAAKAAKAPVSSSRNRVTTRVKKIIADNFRSK